MRTRYDICFTFRLLGEQAFAFSANQIEGIQNTLNAKGNINTAPLPLQDTQGWNSDKVVTHTINNQAKHLQKIIL